MKNDKGRITRGFATRDKYVEKYLGQFWRDKNIRVAFGKISLLAAVPLLADELTRIS